MVTRLYTTGQFAARAGVSLRTVRYYHRVGILPPSSLTPAGHRRYADRDLIGLQQILALKFLGFSLESIRQLLRLQPSKLADTLEIQRQLIMEQSRRLDTVMRAIEALQQSVAQQSQLQWESIVQVIKVIQMQEDKDWWKKHYTPEQVEKLEAWGKEYPEEKRKEGERAWEEVIAGVKAAAARGEDPASPAVQELAQRWDGLIKEFTRGDPGIEESLQRMYSGGEMQFPRPYNDEEAAFVQKALDIYQGR